MDDDESIYNLIKFEKYNGKMPLYKSKHPHYVFPTGSTIGLQNSSAVIQNQIGSQKRPKLYHDRPMYKPTMGQEETLTRKSIDPRHFLRKGEGVSTKAEKPLFRIKSGKSSTIGNNLNTRYDDFDKLPKIMIKKNLKDADRTQSNMTDFNENPLNKEFSKDSQDIYNKHRKKISNRISQIAKSVSLNPIQEEDEISKGPVSFSPGLINKVGKQNKHSYMNPKKYLKPTPEIIHEQCINTISSNTTQNQVTKFPRSRMNSGGVSFENWRENRGHHNVIENVLPDEEREMLREDLQMKYNTLIREYQKITHKSSYVISQIKRQKELEERLNFIEESLKKLERPVIYVLPGTA